MEHKTFKDLLVEQLQSNPDNLFEDIEVDETSYGFQVWAWNRLTKSGIFFDFDHNGNLIEIS